MRLLFALALASLAVTAPPLRRSAERQMPRHGTPLHIRGVAIGATAASLIALAAMPAIGELRVERPASATAPLCERAEKSAPQVCVWPEHRRYLPELTRMAQATAAIALRSAFFGGTHIALPCIGSGGVTTGVPFRHELPLLSAVFLTAVLDGAMSVHAELGASAMHRFRLKYCAGLPLMACAFSFSTEALAVGPEAGVVFVRSLLIWLGLALLSVRLLGHQLGWIIPLASALFLIWYPHNRWDWTSNSAADLLSWAVAAMALCVGVAATAATPWRRKAFSEGETARRSKTSRSTRGRTSGLRAGQCHSGTHHGSSTKLPGLFRGEAGGR
ncbi:hypothetical protein [Streptomyces sp. NPDC087525]|uniref:hypothetical protein n=1 Tax=Streptomyces sp. NPDC087525 TaxID=3365793 RepID=UPI00382A23E6